MIDMPTTNSIQKKPMHLYGITAENIAINTADISKAQLKMLPPSEAFISHIKALRRGTTIALTTINPNALQNIVISSSSKFKSYELLQTETEYFAHIAKACQVCGHRIIYITQPNDVVNILRVESKINGIIEEIKHVSNFKEMQTRREALYASQMYFAYLMFYAPFVKAIAEISRIQPDILITNVYTADNLWAMSTQNSTALATLSIASYSLDIQEKYYPLGGIYFSKISQNTFMALHGHIDKERINNSVLNLDYIGRYYKLSIEGKLTNNKPDYLGTLTFATPQSGFFELYINATTQLPNGERVFGGRIEAVTGSSSVNGILSKEQIWFTTKIILPPYFSNNEKTFEIKCKGVAVQGMFMGNWNIEGRFLHDQFILSKPEDYKKACALAHLF